MKHGKYAKKPYRKRLDDEIVKQLLANPSSICKGGTIAEGLERARTIQERMVQEATEHLSTSPLTQMVAESLARQERRRGQAVITIDPDGTVYFEVRYGVDTSREEEANLPSLSELREAASDVGVDVSDLGRSRKKIKARLQSPPEKERKPMLKTGLSITPARIIEDEEDFDDIFGTKEPEEPEVSEGLYSTPPPKQIEMAPVKRKGLLSKIMKNAEKVDIDALLAPDEEETTE